MAQILDERLDGTLEADEQFASFDDDTTTTNGAQESVQPEVAQQPTDDDDLPEKYRGKSAKEIARMHMEAEKMMGKHSSEVGELRSVVDSFIKTQLATNKPSAPTQEVEEVDDVDFYTNPKEAVRKALDSHPAVRQAQQAATKLAQQEALATITSRHPDAIEVANDAEFIEWVKASKIRTQLYTNANNYDTDSALELLDTWKERKGMVAQTKQVMETDRKAQMKAASTGNVTGSSEVASKKIYRRADIVKLMQNDPDRYATLYSEIAKAYSEGRVR